MRRAALILASVIIFLVSAVLADRYILPIFIDNSKQQGILFPPGSEFPYKTTEFSHIARINSLGFRDREWERTKEETTIRIAAIGDSFTFGMGVNLEQTWPKILEEKLRTSGFNVEIANLGSPGASPSQYVTAARKATPILNPDIILVAILQGDDIAQGIREAEISINEHNNPLLEKTWEHTKLAAQTFFPNSVQIIKQQKADRSSFRSRERSLQKIWKEQAEKLAGSYTKEKKARFDRIGATARTMFLEGNLNPGIVSMAMADPQYFVTPLQSDNTKVQRGLKQLQGHLLEMKKVAGKARLLVISVPAGIYVSNTVRQAAKEIGFTVTKDMLQTNMPDEILEKVCSETAIPFYSVTDSFRKTGRAETLYYTYDGHFNARGHEVFAGLLLPLLEKYIMDAERLK